jgi:hypothetical protein
MRRWGASPALLATLLALVLHTSTATAAGFDLRWDACAADAGVANKDFACDADDGSHTMVASFILAQPLTGVFLAEAVLDLIVAEPAGAGVVGHQRLPVVRAIRGRHLQPRFGQLRRLARRPERRGDVRLHERGTIAPADSASHRRMTVIGGVSTPVNLVANQDYFVFNLILVNSSRWIREPAQAAPCPCASCSLDHSEEHELPGAREPERAGHTGSNFATWQGGTGANCLSVPARRTTWGAVKSLYR